LISLVELKLKISMICRFACIKRFKM